MGPGLLITVGTVLLSKLFAKAQQMTLVETDLVLKLRVPDIIKQKMVQNIWCAHVYHYMKFQSLN